MRPLLPRHVVLARNLHVWFAAPPMSDEGAARARDCLVEAAEQSILAVGAGPPDIGGVKPAARWVRASTPALATDRLRKQPFDLVVFRGGFTNDEIAWLAGLRAAKPFMPIVAVHDYDTIPRALEVRLRSAGVTALFSVSTKEFEVWLYRWMERQTLGKAAHQDISCRAE